jgi:hypothetical protein
MSTGLIVCSAVGSVGMNTLLHLERGCITEIPRLRGEVRGRDVAVPDYWDGAADRRMIDGLAGVPCASLRPRTAEG